MAQGVRQPVRVRRLTLHETANLYRLRRGAAVSKPLLRLCGRWLVAAGFPAGSVVRVEVSDGRLVIMRED